MHQTVAPRPHEEALESWREAGDSMGGLLEQHGIEIREFVILSYLCEHADLTVQQIAEGVSLSVTTVDFCVSQLGKARLARQNNKPGSHHPVQMVATRKGKYLVHRAKGADVLTAASRNQRTTHPATGLTRSIGAHGK